MSSIFTATPQQLRSLENRLLFLSAALKAKPCLEDEEVTGLATIIAEIAYEVNGLYDGVELEPAEVQ